MTALLHPHHLKPIEYPHIDGFQSTLLFSVLHNGGVVGTPSRQFVQILHTGGNHWVTASNLFCPKNQVCIYDSLSTVMYNKEKQILSWLLRPVEDHFLVTYPAVQQQSNSSNCVSDLCPHVLCFPPSYVHICFFLFHVPSMFFDLSFLPAVCDFLLTCFSSPRYSPVFLSLGFPRG